MVENGAIRKTDLGEETQTQGIDDYREGTPVQAPPDCPASSQEG